MALLDVRGVRVEARWPQGGHLLFLDEGLVGAALASLEAGQRFEYIRAPVGEDLVVASGRVYYRSGSVWRSVESPDPVAWTTLYLLMAVLGAPRSRLLSVRRDCLERIIESIVAAPLVEPLRVTLHPYYTVRRDGRWARLVLAEGLSVVAGRWVLREGLDTLLLLAPRGRSIVFVDVEAGEVEGVLKSLGVEVARVERRLWLLDGPESPVYISTSARMVYALLDEGRLGEVLGALGFTIPRELLEALLTRVGVEVVGVTPILVHDVGWVDDVDCGVLAEWVKRGDFEKLYILDPRGALDDPVFLPAHRLVYMPVGEAEALLIELLERIDEASDAGDLDDEWLEGPRRIGAAVLEAVREGGGELVRCLEERVDETLFGVNRRFYDLVKALVSRGEAEALAWLVARVSAIANECMEDEDYSPRCAYMLLTSAQAAYITYNLLRCWQGLGEREGGGGKDAGAVGAG